MYIESPLFSLHIYICVMCMIYLSTTTLTQFFTVRYDSPVSHYSPPRQSRAVMSDGEGAGSVMPTGHMFGHQIKQVATTNLPPPPYTLFSFSPSTFSSTPFP